VSILSGSHLVLVPEVLRRLREEGVDITRVPVVVGGIIPDQDAAKLLEEGVERVLTPMSEGLTMALGSIAGALGRSA